MRTHALLWPLIAALVLTVAGCDDNSALQQRLRDLETENKELKDKLQKLSDEMRPLAAKVDRLDMDQRTLEKTLAQARKDLEAQVADMVQQEVSGRRGPRRFPVPPPPARIENKPYMGFDAQDIEPDVAKALNLKAKTGVLITAVRDGAPAAVAGLKQNDVIVGIDQAEVNAFNDLKRALEGKKPGEVVTLRVLRGEEKLEMKVTLGARPERVED